MVVEGARGPEAPRRGVVRSTVTRTSGLRRGSNLTHVSDFNDAVVLDAIRRSEHGISRAELTSITGLAPQTVSDICQRLLDQGLVAETGTTSAGLGRPRRILELVPDSRYALGLHIDPATVTFVMLDFSGRVVAHAQKDIDATGDPEVLLRLLATAIERLVVAAGVDRGRVIGLGIAAPGPIDAEGGIVVGPPMMPGWDRVLLRDRLTDLTGWPVVLDKDVTAAAIGERWSGAAVGSSDFLFLYLGTGVGVGLVTGDIVVRGVSSNAGDMGHLIVDSDGARCPCGQRGCIGIVCSPTQLVIDAAAVGIIDTPPPRDDLGAALRLLATIRSAADQRNPAALALLDRHAQRIARAVDVIGGLTDTELAVIGGPAWSPFADYLGPAIESFASDQFVMRYIHDIRVTGTTLGEDVGAIGAACLSLDRMFAAQPASLLLG